VTIFVVDGHDDNTLIANLPSSTCLITQLQKLQLVYLGVWKPYFCPVAVEILATNCHTSRQQLCFQGQNEVPLLPYASLSSHQLVRGTCGALLPATSGGFTPRVCLRIFRTGLPRREPEIQRPRQSSVLRGGSRDRVRPRVAHSGIL
jgi:hypothetical protein